MSEISCTVYDTNIVGCLSDSKPIEPSLVDLETIYECLSIIIDDVPDDWDQFSTLINIYCDDEDPTIQITFNDKGLIETVIINDSQYSINEEKTIVDTKLKMYKVYLEEGIFPEYTWIDIFREE